MKAIGITGGIAEGKSTVLSMIAAFGHSVESADEIAKSVRQRPDVQISLARAAGLRMPLETDALRNAMADPVIRRSVNAVMHRPILEAIRGSSAAFLEVPLLIETCLQDEFREIWVVTCGVDEQLRRLEERYGLEAAKAMIQTQLPTRAKIPFADHIVRTNSTLEAVRDSIRQLTGN